jgi:hypothetical protein
MEDSIRYSLLWAGIFLGAAIILTAPILLVVLFASLVNWRKHKQQISPVNIP